MKESRVVVQLQCESASPLQTTYPAYLDAPPPEDCQDAKLHQVDPADFLLANLEHSKLQYMFNELKGRFQIC